MKKYIVMPTRQYKKSFQQLLRSGKLKKETRQKLDEIVNQLASGATLSRELRDHQLKGTLQDYRECHIKGDLLLLYRIKKEMVMLVLINIGTHSSLDV